MTVIERNLKKNIYVCVHLKQIHYKSTTLQKKVKKKKKDLYQVQMLTLNVQLIIKVIFWQFVIKPLWEKPCA